jgi:chemotaxis response regulator CheB
MGRNGFRGLLDLHEKGWDTIDQDERTSLRSGRPKAADTILALDRIGQTGMDQLAAKEGMSHG